MKIKGFLIAVLTIAFQMVLAQPDTDEMLAKQFFDNREFDKSSILYEKLFNRTHDLDYFNGCLQSLIELKDYKAAEKFIKKQSSKNDPNPVYEVHLGAIYKLSGNEAKSQKEYDDALSHLIADHQTIISVAQTFSKYNELDYVIKTYSKGRKLMRGMYPFSMELADAFRAKGDYAEMYKEYLDLLNTNTIYLGQIQYMLQGFIGDDFSGPKADELRIQLLKNIQQYPDNSVFSEFLIWFFIQQKDFESAFIQAKALDKRSKGTSMSKVINVAQICVSNMEYDIAIKCYEYEVQKGQRNPYYMYARTELVNTIQKKITNTSNYTLKDLSDLESIYKSALTEMGYNAQSIGLIRGLAHLKGFYLNQPQEALELLQKALEYPNSEPSKIAECKLELGDIYVFLNEMWEPALLYGQVEKAFKHDALGQEAKFRNARLSFYKGEFEWAQAQLTVLKGATSKLIANDALELSLLISDNTVDSNYVPLLIYARAALLSYQNNDSLALLTLDSIGKEFPGHSLSDDVLFKKYKIYFKEGKFTKAMTALENIILNYSDDVLGDDATYYLAQLYEYNLKDNEKAKKYYQDILLNYPGSLYTVEARKKYRKMRGDIFN